MRYSRRPDGSREIQSVDDLLRQAVEDLPIHRLPGGGAPIDLSGYFASGPEHRVGNKLISDNGMVPQPLRQRRNLETRQRGSIPPKRTAGSEANAS